MIANITQESDSDCGGRTMRLAILAITLLFTVEVQAEEPAANVAALEPNTMISVTTPTLTYKNVLFLREQNSAGTIYWVLKTDSGITTVPRPAITKFEVVLPGNPRQSLTQGAAPAAGSLELRIHGSNTVGTLLAPELAKAYARRDGLTLTSTRIVAPEEADMEYGAPQSNRHYKFHFQAHGSATAFQSLLVGAADIGMASRPVSDNELAALEQSGLGNLQSHYAENVIALDGVVVIVNPGNPVQSLTIDQIARVFAGQIKGWQEIGGKPGPINIYARDSKSGTFDTFKSLVLDAGSRELTEAAKRFESSEELSDAVTSDPSGIGFIGFAYVRNAKPLAISTSCGLHLPAEPFLVRTEEYPLSRRLYFYVPESRRSEQVNDFMSFTLSAGSQPVTAAAGFIGLNAEESTEAYTKQRSRNQRTIGGQGSPLELPTMQSFAEKSGRAVRLSITFRFKKGSTELDSRAHEDVKRLAAYIGTKPGAGSRIMLFGFSDAKGNFQHNLQLSRERALQVADALGTLGIALPRDQIEGFSSVAPVACSDNEVSIEKNRRVEVWLRG
jgi:phosphate transport system substrate-binding protein